EIIANECILTNGQSGKSIELVTNRDGFKIPMRNESTGILKIISIIQTLIAYCTYDDIFVAIDELDAGIFEYLLGNLLCLLSKEGKGQLFFSSHNLRPLEILNKNCIYFSTSNPLNRYIKMSNVKKNNNLRDFYLRTVELGGQKEYLYNDDDMAGLEIILKRMEKNG
ncbi:MAG: ATP-binding protein, partial [Clostridia bacterium]|nr:ATP-binding protein [Clostridia bacterium]